MDNQAEYVILAYFLILPKGKNAERARKKLYQVYGEDCERHCQRWFALFRSGNLTMQDDPCIGRTITTEDNKMKALVGFDRHVRTP